LADIFFLTDVLTVEQRDKKGIMPVYSQAISKRALRRKQTADAAAVAEESGSDTEVTPEVVAANEEQTTNAAAGDDTGAVLQFNEPAQWVERMALTAVKSLPSDLAPDDDPKREEVFIQQTLLSVVKGLSMLEQANIPWRRPKDYYAEMFKDDTHMNKIRESIDKSKKQVEERAHRRAMKDQKKFGKEVQAEVLRQRAKYKRDLNDRISDWKKKRRGNDESIDDVLGEEDDSRGGRGGRGGGRGGRGGRGGGGGRGGPRSAKKTNLRPGGQRPGKNSRRRQQ
jgi:rRNA-processing protein EBP2